MPSERGTRALGGPACGVGAGHASRGIYAFVFCVSATTALKQLKNYFFSMSFATESNTPLMNVTDSGVENLRAISSASLMITGFGVFG